MKHEKYSWRLKLLTVVLLVGASFGRAKAVITQTIPSYVLPDDTYSEDIYQLAQSSTVRVVQDHASGTGVIVHQQGEIYSVLTNWHVVAIQNNFQIVAADGRTYPLLQPPQQLGNLDLAIIQFQSPEKYQVPTVAQDIPEVGEKIYAAGFPLYRHDASVDTIALGNRAFRLTQGEVSLIPPKSLPEGYHLGYTNDTEIGMSGGPIFNDRGFLIGVHGRGKFRDPDFGVYTFEDGSEPTPEMLETMVNSSWGIPITSYLQFTSPTAEN